MSRATAPRISRTRRRLRSGRPFPGSGSGPPGARCRDGAATPPSSSRLPVGSSSAGVAPCASTDRATGSGSDRTGAGCSRGAAGAGVSAGGAAGSTVAVARPAASAWHRQGVLGELGHLLDGGRAGRRQRRQRRTGLPAVHLDRGQGVAQLLGRGEPFADVLGQAALHDRHHLLGVALPLVVGRLAGLLDADPAQVGQRGVVVGIVAGERRATVEQREQRRAQRPDVVGGSRRQPVEQLRARRAGR